MNRNKLYICCTQSSWPLCKASAESTTQLQSAGTPQQARDSTIRFFGISFKNFLAQNFTYCQTITYFLSLIFIDRLSSAASNLSPVNKKGKLLCYPVLLCQYVFVCVTVPCQQERYQCQHFLVSKCQGSWEGQRLRLFFIWSRVGCDV